jgi:hypothetical protein
VPGTAGRSAPSSRLLSRLHIAVMGYPEPGELEVMCTQLLRQVSKRGLLRQLQRIEHNAVAHLGAAGNVDTMTAPSSHFSHPPHRR